LAFEEKVNSERLAFETRKNVDAAYQAIVQELCSDSPLLRAAAAVKLGKLLESIPAEWSVSGERQKELIDLTKRVIAAALSTETDPKVLKTLTISLVEHRPWKNLPDKELRKRSDAARLDLSGANATDAYWAWADFSYADFYNAVLTRASFRGAILRGAQFRQANLNSAVFVEADCGSANFKLADLRDADFSKGKLQGANFERARVAGVKLSGAILGDNNPYGEVDVSKEGEEARWVSIEDWLAG
jgi:hypothetical protein